jgi:hypothetical protein
MSDKNLESCVKIGKSASEISSLITLSYGACAMKKSSVLE